MSFFRGSSSIGGGAADDDVPSAWPTSIGVPETLELHRYCLLVPSGCRLPRNWKIDADHYATPGPSATEEELRNHSGGRHNIEGRKRFWCGKDYWEVMAAFRLGAAGESPDLTGRSGRLRAPPPPHDRHRRGGGHGVHRALAPAPAAAPLPPGIDLPPEQVILREDGDPDDTPGYHVAVRASEAAAAAAEAMEAAEIAAAIQAAQQAGMAVPEWQQEWEQAPAEWQQASAEEEDSDDDPVDWDDLANRSSSDDDGGDIPAVIDLVDSDNE
ncbi:unnamed protein product [Triticum turgidum subsp. durum]|uniref:Uncharacterized protein n=1 Tax=Triticum turgidum subsp. durum TaxID=4567 RepID=A0A9R0Z166_TRITD|nr:unnamed protein product [Triticum turgidum subsp. durum]